jgi:hypothetical protein
VSSVYAAGGTLLLLLFFFHSHIPFRLLQLVANRSMAIPLRELRRLIRLRLAEDRDVVGFDLAALRLISRVANDRKNSFLIHDPQPKDIWAGMGLGSDVAAALEGRSKNKR